MKPKILYTDIVLFQPWILPLWKEYVDVEKFDPTRNYDRNNVMVLVSKRNDKEQYLAVKSQGYKIILDYVQDSHTWDTDFPGGAINNSTSIIDNELNLCSKDWFRIHEALQSKHNNYHCLPGNTITPDKFFLLLMNIKKYNRELLFNSVTEYLDDSLYSYVEKGIFLSGDKFLLHPEHNGTANVNESLYVPEWYTQTSFSLVSETMVDYSWLKFAKPINKQQVHITEKTFKTLAYLHPFVVFGTPYILNYLKNLGFETFHHIIDESYDLELNTHTRLQKIITVLDDLYAEFKKNKNIFQDNRTKEILAHNRDLFFDDKQIISMFTEQLIIPVLDLANT